MYIKIKDPGSAITHFIAMIGAITAAFPLIYKTFYNLGKGGAAATAVFIGSMILLYGASTLYHTVDVSEKVNKTLKRLDHMMIFVLIAGTYTPVCLLVIKGTAGIALLAAVWAIAIVGIVIKMIWINCPKWFSSIIYITMGWTCVFAFSQIVSSLSTPAFLWLLAGGIIYTVGGIIYALKLPIFNSKHKYFGSHEIFHLFVMAGSLCHFILMFVYVAK